MTLSEELTWRGFVNQTTFSSITELDDEPRTIYFGVDPSGPGMQIGNLASAMMVRQLAAKGHTVYLLLGGATGMIGDPDGKLDERDLRAVEEVEANKAEIKRQYESLFVGLDIHIVDNNDWFQHINYLSFLRDIGKHVPMSMMLGRDFIQTRLGEGGSGISYAEFSYALIQAYDFLHLYREYGVSVQLCGADQWGNAIAGVDMVRRIEGGQVHVLSAPLIINHATGRKFGKTEGGAVWLNPALTSPYKFYQFWLNVDDVGVIEYMKVYTLLSREHIDSIAAEHTDAPERRVAQKTLAYEVTKIVHGVDRANAAREATAVLFGGAPLESDQVVEMLSQELPVATTGQFVSDILVAAEVAKSKGEVRRLIAGSAISINGQKVSEDIVVESRALIKKGKNTFIVVR